MREYHQTIFV